MFKNTNYYGLQEEEKIRAILPEIGIPEAENRNGHKDYFCWATPYEDHKLGVDCWLVLGGREYPVDFTIISNEDGVRAKTEKAVRRGVIPVFLCHKTINAAEWGAERALREIEAEIRCQVSLKRNLVSQTMQVRQRPNVQYQRQLVAVA